MEEAHIVANSHDLLKPFLVLIWRSTRVDEDCHELTVEAKDIHIIGCDGDDKTKLLGYASHFAGSIKLFASSKGVIQRVFRNGKPEMSPNISYYSEDEYPHRDFALRCGILASYCFPFIYRDFALRCGILASYRVCVVEIVSTRNQDVNALWKFCQSFRQLELFFDFYYIKIQEEAIPEIKQLLQVVCQKFQLPLAQYRTYLDNYYYVVQQLSCREFEKFEPWSQYKHACLRRPLYDFEEGFCGDEHYFWKDVTKLSITDHSLTHYARDCGSIACLQIYLDSPYPQDRKYVLEFYLPSQDIDSYYPQTFLQSLFSKTKEHLPNYMIEGEELGQMLSVQVGNSFSHDEPGYFNIILPKSNSYLPHHEGSGCNSTLNSFQNVNESEKESDVMCTESQSLASQHKKPEGILKYKGSTAEIGHSALKINLGEASKIKQHNETVERADEALKESIIKDTGYATCNMDTRNDMTSTSQPYTLCQQEETVILEDDGHTSQQLSRISQALLGESTEPDERVFEIQKCTPDIDSYEEISTGTISKKTPKDVEQITHLDELKGKSPLKCVEPQSLPSQPRRSEEIFGDEGYIVATERVDNLVDVSPDEDSGYAVTTLSKRLKKSKLPFTKENILKHFGRPLKDAAESFGVSVSTFKRRCRDVGIEWWQPGKSKIIDGEPGKNNFSLGNQDVPNRHVIHSRQAQDSNTMTVKITYKTDTMRFELPSSSGIAELENNVTERLSLERKSFHLKYQDEEGDWITIYGDEDVQQCMKVSRSLNKPTIRMLLVNNCVP